VQAPCARPLEFSVQLLHDSILPSQQYVNEDVLGGLMQQKLAAFKEDCDYRADERRSERDTCRFLVSEEKYIRGQRNWGTYLYH